MSGFLPANTSLQLSDSSGNINHLGVLTSNTYGTPLLPSTFPSSSTGNSTAHAHYTDASSNSLKFLNASANGRGGHEFWVSTSSSAPKKTASLDVSGFTIDNSISGGNVIYSPNVFLLSPDGKNIELDGDLYASPYNFNLQTFNPVYMTQTTSLYTTGDLCYVVCGSDRVIQIFNNNNITNPIPPNVVPSDFGNSSNVGFTIGIPLFSLSPPSQTITKISNLSETLTIINDTDESVLSASDLTFNNVSLPSQVSQNTLDISQNRTDISKNILDISQNRTDISQNILDISQNTFDISNNTDDINTLTIKQTNLIYQFSSPAIYADGSPPLATPTTIINTYAINAWYFKNTVAGQKINWYMPSTSGLKVQDILGLYLRLFNVSTTSNDNTLFLTVYTTPDAGPNYSWYKSRMTYILNQSITPTINTLYTFFMNASGTCPNPSSYASSLVNMQISPVSNPRGTYGPTESIMFFSIGSNSASAVNSVECVVQKFGVITPIGTQEFQFAPLL